MLIAVCGYNAGYFLRRFERLKLTTGQVCHTLKPVGKTEDYSGNHACCVARADDILG
jgi:hypothetical protein